MRLIVASLIVLFSANGIASQPRASRGLNLLGCIDCFNFVAPGVLGAENVNPAEIGLIVYDSSYQMFRGFNQSGLWSKLSTERRVHVVNSATAVPVTDDVVVVNATSGAFTLTLPTAAAVPGKEYIFKKSDSSSNQITVDANGAETIDGSAARKLSTQNESMTIVSDGSGWVIISRQIPSDWVSFTPTGSWTAQTTYQGWWRRVGDSMEVQIRLSLTGAPSPATSLNIALPAGYVIDTTKQYTGSGSVLGVASILDSGSTFYAGNVFYSSTTDVFVTVENASGTYTTSINLVTPTVPMTFAASDAVSTQFRVPIVGW